MAMEKTRIAKVDDVELWRKGKGIAGTLHITPHHLIFQYIPPQPKEGDGVSKAVNSRPKESWIAYPIIHTCVLSLTHPTSGAKASIRLRGRDFTYVRFFFKSEGVARDAYESIRAFTCRLGRIDKLYAFEYEPPKQEKTINGWHLYDARKEWDRLGVGTVSKGWRISRINEKYEFCPTYPSLLVVPTSISDNTLGYAGPFRSRNRLPVLTYIHPINNCSITRSAQPMTGMRSNRNVQDEKLVQSIFNTSKNQTASQSVNVSRETTFSSSDASTNDEVQQDISQPPPPSQPIETESSPVNDPESATAASASTKIAGFEDPEAAEQQVIGETADKEAESPPVYGAQQSNIIFDARPQLNATVMHAAGMGTELIANYPFCSKMYLGIDNIHVMRDSLQAVINVIKDSDVYESRGLDRDALQRSNWLKHIGQLLEGANKIVTQIAFRHSHVLIHCSDGWDRTSQLSALAQLCLDPYYRTIDGFVVLVEKDWLSYGHMFAHRSGFLSSDEWFKIENERSGSVNEGDRGAVGQVGGTGLEKALENAFLNTKDFTKGLFNNKEQTKSRESLHGDTGFDSDAAAGSESPQRGSVGGGIGGLFGRKTPSKQPGATKVKETSPIFHQFLDATYQILRQHPGRFEFNERFLRRLLYHLYSCQYGTFLYNSERERTQAKVSERTASVWDHFLSRRQEFVNPAYDATIDDRTRGKERVLLPSRQARWWSELFGRKDEEMNGSSGSGATGGGNMDGSGAVSSSSNSVGGGGDVSGGNASSGEGGGGVEATTSKQL